MMHRRCLFLALLPLVWPLADGAGPLYGQAFRREVDPFPVRDAAGEAYEHPFLGGFNAPRPQFADLDADGDLDLFVQEETGRVRFFENVGSPAAYRFRWRTDRFEGLETGEWFRFADLDADGDLDLLTEQPLSHVRFYRNEGTPARARFRLAADTLRDADGRPVFLDRQNVPALADLDCDGLPDLFMASTSGTLVYYAGLPPGPDGVPRFRFVTDRFGDVLILGGAGKAGDAPGRRHGASAITFADLDADGDLDLFWGDFFSPSLYYLENTGTCAAPALRRTADHFPLDEPVRSSGQNVPAFADLDADGDLDLFVGVLGGAYVETLPGTEEPFLRDLTDNFYFFEHTEAGFTLRTRRFLSTVDVGEESVPALADLDGDGDLDLVLANALDPVGARAARLYLFENTGTAASPALRHAGPLDLDLPFGAAPAFADIDADGDPDLFVGSFGGAVAFYRNEGGGLAPRFVPVTGRYADVAVPAYSAPAFADVDADGDPDLFVGSAAGEVAFYRNVGTPEEAAFVPEPPRFGGPPLRRSRPALGDVDGDGDADLLVGAAGHGLRLYRNAGSARAPSFVPDTTFAPVAPDLPAPALADLDADGDADLLAGTGGGGLVFFRQERGATTATPPETPPAGGPLLHGHHPNPFRTVTTLRFTLREAAHVRLVVYDLLGRRVALVLDGPLPAGLHAVPFDARALPAGRYPYLLRAGSGPPQAGILLVGPGE